MNKCLFHKSKLFKYPFTLMIGKTLNIAFSKFRVVTTRKKIIKLKTIEDHLEGLDLARANLFAEGLIDSETYFEIGSLLIKLGEEFEKIYS